MLVLNLSLDKHILEKDSAVQRRLVALAVAVGNTTPALADSGTPFDKGGITILVPSEQNRREQISERLTIQSVGGPKFLQFLKLWSKGSKALQAKKYDLITAQDAYFVGLLGYALSQRFKIPLEIQVHGLEKFSGLRKRIARFVLRRARQVRVVSERLKHSLYSIFHIPYSKMYVIPIYTQINVSQKISRRKSVPYPFTFLTVGRLVPVKNVALQISAFAKVAEKIPHIRLRIVGDGPLKESLQLQVESLKLGDKVIFEGGQKNVSRFYEEANAFLLTSDSEGWGRVVLEAAAHKLPIIMTDVGLAREVIKNGESGFVIPIGDEQELALAMKELIDKPELRATLGEGAYRAYRALPGSEEHIQKQIEAWQVPYTR